MAFLKINSKGFGVIETLLLIIAITGVVGVGVYVVKQNSDKSTSSVQEAETQTNKETASTSTKAEQKVEPYKAVISFKDNGSLTAAQKNEISLKLAEPLSFYHFKNLNIPLKEVVIERGDTEGYKLSYVYAENPDTNKFGFVFNAIEVKYWQPQLCDHGGCKPYPETLKQAYPANFKAYEACQAAEGDKEKQSSLGCDYTS